MRNHYQSIPDRSRAGLPTTASGVHSRASVKIMLLLNIVKIRAKKKRRKASEEAARSVERKTLTHKGGTLNIGTMTGRGRELADMMERRNADILCLQETNWKGNKASNIEGGYKIFYSTTELMKEKMG